MAKSSVKDEDVVNSTKLKAALWDTLQEVKGGTIQPVVANSVATQAREILRTVKIELQFASAKNSVPAKTKKFAE